VSKLEKHREKRDGDGGRTTPDSKRAGGGEIGLHVSNEEKKGKLLHGLKWTGTDILSREKGPPSDELGGSHVSERATLRVKEKRLSGDGE